MVLLSVLDILLVIVGGAGVVYQAVCILISLFTVSYTHLTLPTIA